MADQQQGLVKYETDTGEVQLSGDIVRKYLVSGQGQLTTQEVASFIKLCQYRHLNPFLREAYIIKYGSGQYDSATIVVGKEVFTKRAAKNPRFDGFEAGITIANANGELIRREGSLALSGEQVIGGWARVYLKDTKVPVFAEASFDEYAGRKKDGTLNKTWAGKPATMIRKVALVQALREAFPDDLGGMYDAAEMQTDTDALPKDEVRVTATVIEPESQPEAKPKRERKPKDEPKPEVDEVEAEYEVVEDDAPESAPVAAEGALFPDEASQDDIDTLAAYGPYTLTSTSEAGSTLVDVWTREGRAWFEQAASWAKDNAATVAKKGLTDEFDIIAKYLAAQVRIAAAGGAK